MNAAVGRALPLLIHAFLLQGAAYVVRPTSAYRAMELGLSPGLVGLIAASFALVPLIVAVPVGRWTDRGREFATLMIGGVAMVLGGVGLLVFSGSLWALLIWNAVIGFGHLLCVIGQQSVVARAGRRGLDTAFGTYTFVGSLGQAAAPLLLAGVGGQAIIPDTFALLAVYTSLCVALVAVTVWMRPLASRTPSAAAASGASGSLHLEPGKGRTMLGAILLSTLVLAAIDLIQVYMPALGVERGIESWVIGLLLTMRAGATMVSRIGLATLTGLFGRRRLVVVSSVIAGVAVGVLAMPVHPGVLGGAMVVAGFCLGVGQPLSMTLVTLAAPKGATSTWLAVRLVGNRFGQSVVPGVLTLVTTATGTAGIFVVTGIGLLGTAAFAQFMIRDDL
ncbi:MAG: MFS transporter [Propioniciclava sp.]|uniref:MFS transporter n=1 Tax=Propioniciclava sp. TaxID=2038686 RepID=UPI0039E6B453